MKRSDSTILMILPLVALVVAFWFLVLAPKRKEASKLGDEVAKLQTAVDEHKRAAADAVEAKESFPDNYQKVVELGRAVPQDDDTASLFRELSAISRRVGVEFRAIELNASQSPAPAPATPPASDESSGSGDSGSGGEGSGSPDSGGQGNEGGGESSGATPTSTTTPAPATEATAASLPIGAAVGPAGFPVMPYKLEFRGDFFRVADFIHQLDQMVRTKDGRASVHGRLLTIDGFALKENTKEGFPSLTAKFSITTYLTPADQGISAGATPQAPAPAAPGQAAPAPAATAPTAPTSTPTAAPGGTG